MYGNTISGEELQALNDSSQATVAVQEAANATEEEIADAQSLNQR
ncbi:hypothetical protein [Virgibacillus sp. 7505]|nr:hypothetical protein [Virgibacillus sp. 7505]